jgi:hypothetical protein
MPRALLAVLLGLLLLGCGGEVVPGTATPIVPTVTALLVSAPTADLLPTSAPVTVTRVPSDTLALPAMSANQQIFATGTAPPPVPTQTTRSATPVPPTKPVARATAVPTARPAAKAPTATAAPTDCLTKAERAYVTQANAILSGIHAAERTMIANMQNVDMQDPIKQAAYTRASDTLKSWVHQGEALHAPAEWQTAQPFWERAMWNLENIWLDITTSPLFFMNSADDTLVDWQDLIQPLIDARCG